MIARGGKIGCEGYVLLGFDAGAKFQSIEPPAKQVYTTDKRFEACSRNNNQCRGIFQRVNLHGPQPDFLVGLARQVKLSGIVTFQGSETHIPVGIMQFHCNFGKQCDLPDTTTITTIETMTSTSTTTALRTTTTLRTTPKKSTTSATRAPQTTKLQTPANSLPPFRQYDLNSLMNHLVVFDANQQRIRAADLAYYGCSALDLESPEGPREGVPVDLLDAALRKWHDCRKCAKSSAMDRGKLCSAKYSFDVFFMQCGK